MSCGGACGCGGSCRGLRRARAEDDGPIYKEFPMVYLAGPFFKPDQVACIDQLEAYLDKLLGKDNVYSPRRIGILKKDASPEERARIFKGNVDGVNGCNLMVAVYENHDAGTMFEWGYAHAKGIPVFAYTPVENRGLNIMLSQSAVGFASGFEQFKERFEAYLLRGQTGAWTGDVY